MKMAVALLMLDNKMGEKVIESNYSKSTKAICKLVYAKFMGDKSIPVAIDHPNGKIFRFAKISTLSGIVNECCDLIEEHGDANVKIKVHYD